MGKAIEIEVPAIGRVGGWLATPPGEPRAGLVVLQEIFGVNAHMRAVVDGYARDGYLALAPALFDPVERGVELGYDAAGFGRGRELVDALGLDRALAVVEAAAARLAGHGLAVGAVGFCWGGTLAFLANTRLGLPAASYYGARTVPFLAEPLRAPMLFHFGADDAAIPADDIARHADLQPTATLHVYPGGHAFNRDVDPKAYVADSARLAHARTLAFLAQALAPSQGASP